MRKKSIAEFWLSVDRRGPDECWEWQGYRGPCGYGRLTWQNQPGKLAHRVAFSLAGGDCSRVVRHRCDNRACCNPAHLQPGTQADNIRDAVARGRQHHPTGEKNGRAVLTEAHVTRIKAVARHGNYSALGREYGVSPSAVWRIAKGIGWA